MRKAGFKQMIDGTREDYLLLQEYEHPYVAALPDRLLASLETLREGLQGYPVSRYEHSLQSATRAWRDGADRELVVAALFHDIGDDLAPFNHSQLAASILRPYVRPEVTWIIEHHGLFQLYYYGHHYGIDRHSRERLRGHRWFAACERFCERWDQAAFDPDYPSEPVATFEPWVREIFTRPAFDPQYTGGARDAW